jgi:catechol 2,3-dioxygenase-like lactoylglutathione lyase family enzyme
MTEPLHDVARIGHAELLTPMPDESLTFFVDVLGMEEEAREGQSVYLRGWGDYLRYSLKLTESPQAVSAIWRFVRGARKRSSGE